jgi:hypothetical protein
MGEDSFVEQALCAFAPGIDLNEDITATYWITDLLNNKHYVGSSEEVQKRADYHKGAYTDSLIHEAIRTLGFGNFTFEILMIGELSDCRSFERELRKFYSLTIARYGYCGDYRTNPKPKHFYPDRAVKWGTPVEIDGILYKSNRDAAIALDIHDSQVKMYKAKIDAQNARIASLVNPDILKFKGQ